MFTPLYGRKRIDGLSAPELRVLGLAADGHTYGEIAGQVHRSEHTIKTHIKNALSKLGARNSTHAVSIAMRRGLIG